MVYQILFFTGAIGFMLMALMGFLGTHSGSQAGHAGVGGHGPSVGHGPHSAIGHGPGHGGSHHGPVHNTAHADSATVPQPTGSLIRNWAQSAGWLLVSPLDLFALATGAGLAGIFLRHLLNNRLLTMFGAVCGALIFDFVILKPLINLLFKAAAPPSEGLEGMVGQPAAAETSFDQKGQGLIRFILGGQTVQILGKLDSSEHKSGVRVLKGDSVIILEVDAKQNVCRVSREIAN